MLREFDALPISHLRPPLFCSMIQWKLSRKYIMPHAQNWNSITRLLRTILINITISYIFRDSIVYIYILFSIFLHICNYLLLSRFIIMLIQSLFIFCTKISFSIIIINSSLSLKEWQEDCHFLKQFRQHFQSYIFYTFQSSWSAILDPKGDIQSQLMTTNLILHSRNL